MPDKFRFAPFSAMELNLMEDCKLSCWMLTGVRWLLPSITEVQMTSDELNSVMGKKSVIFKEKQKRQENFELSWHGEPVGPVQVPQLIQYLTLSVVFLKKKKKDLDRDITNN